LRGDESLIVPSINRLDYIVRGLMLHWFFLFIKYQIWPLPKDPAELKKLANDLQVPLAYARTTHGLDTALVQTSIRETLKSFRNDAPYVALFLVAIFVAIALLVILFAWIVGFLSRWGRLRDSHSGS